MGNFKKQSLTADSLEMTGPPTVAHVHVCLHQDFEREEKWAWIAQNQWHNAEWVVTQVLEKVVVFTFFLF